MSHARENFEGDGCLPNQNLKPSVIGLPISHPQPARAPEKLGVTAEGLLPLIIVMAKDPAVLFYTSDFLSGTLTMNNDHVGMYIRLLCLQHQKGRLSEKDMLCICKSYVEDVYSKFDKDSEGFYTNKRMQYEALRRKSYSESRRKNVLKRYSTYVEHMENENEDENKDKNENKKTYGEASFVSLTDKEHSKLVQRFGQAETEAKIRRLENAIGSKGYKYKSHYHTILNWAERDGVKSGGVAIAVKKEKKRDPNCTACDKDGFLDEEKKKKCWCLK